MKLYKFTSSMLIPAKDEVTAKEIFADESWDFAANAEVEEITEPEELRRYGYEELIKNNKVKGKYV